MMRSLHSDTHMVCGSDLLMNPSLSKRNDRLRHSGKRTWERLREKDGEED